jgi:hypothetical protein
LCEEISVAAQAQTHNFHAPALTLKLHASRSFDAFAVNITANINTNTIAPASLSHPSIRRRQN